mmetsp:Transcript_4517/g.6806  ORF Transcript_4517/g.6806 Transcript_4517/m.6806 type:complete len:115 (+) Transcript_4517:284-628(+)
MDKTGTTVANTTLKKIKGEGNDNYNSASKRDNSRFKEHSMRHPSIGFSGRNKRQSNFGTIGAGIVHGPSFVNIYTHPVHTKRSGSRQMKKRKFKNKIMNSGNSVPRLSNGSAHD